MTQTKNMSMPLIDLSLSGLTIKADSYIKVGVSSNGEIETFTSLLSESQFKRFLITAVPLY